MSKKRSIQLALLTICIVIFSIEQNLAQKWIDEKAGPLEAVERIAFHHIDNRILQEEVGLFEETLEPAPATFAKAISTTINTLENGTWETSIDGHLLWRQRVSSKGAYSLNLGFTDFYLPPSAVLFLSDEHRNSVIGPITQDDNEVHQQWWSPIIPSEEVVIELQIAPEDLSDLKLELTKVNHDFTGFGAVLSGSCNLDVVCSAEDGFSIVDRYRDVINSVGMMMINGSLQCTGVLVNNTRNDCTPYLLTAEHCGINANTAATVVVYWNFQNSTCRQPNSQASGSDGDGPLDEFNSGSTLRAQYDQIDFTLIELDDPIDPDLDPFFVGWDRSTEVVDSAFCVHHPLGDEKRISFDYDFLTFGVLRNFVRVEDWDIGTTERGSSGAPLFTKDKLLVGNLSAGEAACGNDRLDDFGMFKDAWEGAGTAESRLMDWLDPINSGVTQLTGRFCTDVFVTDVPAVSICRSEEPTAVVQLTITSGFDGGADLDLVEATSGLGVAIPTSRLNINETVNILVDATEFEGGEGIVTLRLTSAVSSSDVEIPVSVFDNVPPIAELTSPSNGNRDQSFDIEFNWIGDAERYALEYSTDAGFESGINTVEDLLVTNLSLRGFEALTTYYWRIRSTNECGMSLSEIFSFTTGQVDCSQFSAPDVPIAIGLQPVTISSTINVEEDGTIGDVNVLDVTGRHTWIRDLTITLISPSGTEVVLVSTPCSDEDDFFASFDDDSENLNLDCPLTTGNTFKPADDLSDFNGETARGAWTLEVNDGVAEDGGFLDDWTLELCINRGSAKNFSAVPGVLEICDKDPEAVSFSLIFNGEWENPSAPVVTTEAGDLVEVIIDPNPINTGEDLTVTVVDPTLLVKESMLRISFTDGDDVIEATVPIEHIQDVASPNLGMPSNQEERVALDITFSWEVESERAPETYFFELSRDEGFETLDIEITLDETSYTHDEDLLELTQYYWRVSSIGECSDPLSGTFSFVTDMKVATLDPELTKVKIYPTLADQFVIVDLSEANISGDVSYSIFSLEGALHDSRNLTKTQVRIPLDEFHSGLYFLELRTERGTFTQKIVVSR